MITKELDKGNGIMFDFEKKEGKVEEAKIQENQKLLHSAIKSGMAMSRIPAQKEVQSEGGSSNSGYLGFALQEGSMALSLSTLVPSSSGTILKKQKPWRRPFKSKRLPLPYDENNIMVPVVLKKGRQKGSNDKRKVVDWKEDKINPAMRSKEEIIPKEGLSNI